MTQQAIILAAGQGTRLYPLTKDKPKCMVELMGKPLLHYQLETLHACGIQDIAIVSGYQNHKIQPKPFKHFFINQNYANTNMVSSLFCVRELFDNQSDLIISYGDIIYESKVLQKLLETKAPITLIIDKAWQRYWQIRMDNPLDDAETLKVDSHGNITELGQKTNHYADIQGQYIGLIKIDKAYTKQVKQIYEQMETASLTEKEKHNNIYMTDFLQILINQGWEIKAVPIENGWLEIDSVADLNCYENLHAQNNLQSFYSLHTAVGDKQQSEMI